MTETSSAPTSLTTMRLAELQRLASSMGLKGTSRLRKSELVAAIAAASANTAGGSGGASGGTSRRAQAQAAQAPAEAEPAPTAGRRERQGGNQDADRSAAPEQADGRRRRRAQAPAGSPQHRDASQPDDSGARRSRRGERPAGAEPTDQPERAGRTERPERAAEVSERTDGSEGAQAREHAAHADAGERTDRPRHGRGRARLTQETGAGATSLAGEAAEDHLDAKAALMRDLADATGTPAREPLERRRGEGRDSEDEGRGGRRRRGRKRRDRERGERNDRQGTDHTSSQASKEDEVLIPVAGILDVADSSHAYLRTSGYLAGPKDVYVSGQMMKDCGLRAGDAVTGWIREGGAVSAPGGRAGRRGNRARTVKYNPLVSVETVNGMDTERAKRRPEFAKLTPLYPQEQLRLETTPKALTPRVIDLVSPIGKGQRGLIVSPPKAGKTIVLQQIANAISVNNPEAHLMVVLVDERPEEVTDMQRTVKGEVIASTFDRPASDHTSVAELAIERAKRLVELGQDVVVLLDSITRLGRAYNLAAPASGRILSGGVDASALYPPKRFFGAARNIEKGGSLTILATALVETGSKMDEVIFEEFKGTGNMELRLSRQLAEKRIFPAVDVAASSTRREELLINPAQLKIMWRLRRLFSGLEPQQALEMVIKKLKDTQSNAEFLMAISKTTPAGTALEDDDEAGTVR